MAVTGPTKVATCGDEANVLGGSRRAARQPTTSSSGGPEAISTLLGSHPHWEGPEPLGWGAQARTVEGGTWCSYQEGSLGFCPEAQRALAEETEAEERKASH